MRSKLRMLIARGAAQFGDFGFLGDGNPDFRRKHALHVQRNDALFHKARSVSKELAVTQAFNLPPERKWTYKKLMNEDENESLAETAADLAKDAFTFKPKSQPDEPRDPSWLRWTKFAALILFLSVLIGFVFFCEYYFEQYMFAKHFMDEAAAERIAGDPLRPMKIRIAIGAVIGGGLGMVYVGRCIARGVDP